MAAEKLEIKKNIINLFNKKKENTLKEVAIFLGLSHLNESDRKLIRRQLQDLIEEGLLISRGQIRNRSYIITSKLVKSSATEIGTRYNKKLLDNYIPNQSHYISTNDLKKLLQMGYSSGHSLKASTYANNIMQRMIIDLSWNSSRLEGNTYSLLETLRLIQLNESSEGKDEFESQMILNHKSAIEYLFEIQNEKIITENHIKSIHAILSENLLGDPRSMGSLRNIPVAISGSHYRPLDNNDVLIIYFKKFIKKYNLIKNPFEKSFFALLHLSYLQAFEDINKRTARLVANISLIQNQLKPLSFVGIQIEEYVNALIEFYEKNDQTRFLDLFIKAYSLSSAQYSAVQSSLIKPNKLKIKNRKLIHEIINRIILEKTKGKDLVNKIKKYVHEGQINSNEKEDLILILENELANLHEGNFARFKIRPSEYLAWKKLQG